MIVLCWLALLLGRSSGWKDGYRDGLKDANPGTVIQDKANLPERVWDKGKANYKAAYKAELEKLKNGL